MLKEKTIKLSFPYLSHEEKEKIKKKIGKNILKKCIEFDLPDLGHVKFTIIGLISEEPFEIEVIPFDEETRKKLGEKDGIK